MSAPRHLWSGDWQQESSALGDELASRRVGAGQPAPPEPAVAPPRPRPSAAARVRAWLRAIRRRAMRWRARRWPRPRLTGNRRVRIAVVVGAVALLAAGAAYAVDSALTGGGNNPTATAFGYQRWLGIDLYNSPFGGPIVVGVAPGSPALIAGLQAGDVISAVDGQPVATVSEFASAIARKRAGDHVVLALERGAVTYQAHVTLATRPVGYP